MSRFEISFLDSYTDQGLIDEIRRVAAIQGDRLLTKEGFERLSGRVSASTIQRRFGGWREALERAGVGDLYGGPKISQKMRAQAARRMDEGDLLAEMKRVHTQLGTGVLTKDDFDRASGVTSSAAIRGKFGSWKKAMEKAGIQVSTLGRRYTDEECFENLVAVWTHYGRPPHHDEMKVPPSVVGPKAYVIRWGTWRKALRAFVDWANADGESNVPCATTTQNGRREASPQPAAPPVRREEDCREVKPGLRFRVFCRDKFACVACGRTPKIHNVVLHADHIVSVHEKGKTTLENLQTLCQDCNLGKGKSSII